MKSCSTCGSQLDDQAMLCHVCGASQPTVGRICINCSRQLENLARFCDYCGAQQQESQPAPVREPQVFYARPSPTRIARPPTVGEGREVNIVRLAMISLLVGLLIGFTLGAATFSTQTATTAQRMTETTTLISLQQVTETKTIPVTITQTMWNTPTSILTASEAWREIKRFSNSTGMTTDLFSISSNSWRIRWSYVASQNATFRFFVYPAGEKVAYIESVSSRTPSGSSITYMNKGQSDFYLRIAGTNVDYTIVIEVPT